MKINNLGYLIKEGIRGIFLHGFMSFAAICVSVVCLLIVGTFAGIMYNINIMVEELNRTNEILVYIDSELSEAEARSIGTRINMVDNVYQATFVTREEALENFLADHAGDDAFTGLVAEDLRHRFRVTLQDNAYLSETVEAIEAINGVVNIVAEYELAEGFSTLQDILQVVSFVFIGVLLLVSLLIISNTVKLGMYDRRDEIAIMKMVGATNGFIRLPFIIEGFTLGMLGAGAAFVLLWLMYDWARNALLLIDTLQILSLQPFDALLVPMSVIFAAAGMFVGITGSFASIRKFMNA